MDATPTFARFTGASGLTYQPGLDGVRGLAVAAVVAFHLGLGNVSGGYLGVSLFFTLSGVLIGTLILNEVVTTGRFSLPGFWRRRARRLLPPALLTLAVVAVGRLVTSDLEATTRADVVASGLNVANWHLLVQGSSYDELFSGPSAVLHFWSLAIEEQFYLVVGLLAVVVAGRARRPVRTVFVVAVATAAASFVTPIVTRAGVDRIYYGSDTRAGELMVGVAAAAVFVSPQRRAVLLAKERWVRVAAIGALGATIALWMFVTPGTALLRGGLLPLTATCSLLLVAGALMPGGPVATIARVSPLRWLGGVSYTLYLIHWPLIVVADRLTDSRAWWRSAVIVAAAVALAQLSAVFLERPVRRRLVSARPLAFGVATTLAIVGVAVVVDGRATQSAALLGSLSSAAAPAPAAGDPAPAGDSGSPRIALFGDSIGFSLLLALGDTTVAPQFERAPSEVSLGCGIALSPSPPADPPGSCDSPARALRRQSGGSGPLGRGDDLVPVGAAGTATARSRRRVLRHRAPGVRPLRAACATRKSPTGSPPPASTASCG